METDGSIEWDVTPRVPLLALCDDCECRVIVNAENADGEMAVHHEELRSYQNGAVAAAAVAVAAAVTVLDTEVVDERDLQQEVQEQMDTMTIDATPVVNVSTNEEENNNAVADSLFLSRDAASAADYALEAEVVVERDLQQEVLERMENMTIDAMFVVNMSAKKEEEEKEKKKKARADAQHKSTVFRRIVAAALIILIIAIVSGTVIGTRAPRAKSLAPIGTLSPTPTISVFEFARNILTPLSGEEAFLDESSPHHKALWWMVRDDQANKMMRMMAGNETQLSSSSSSSMLTTFMERYTMALLYFVTDGPNWVSSYDFLSIQSICDWEPIQCNEENAVVGISMGK
jgi:hypothetical protein